MTVCVYVCACVRAEPKGVSTVSDKDEQAGAAQTQQQQQPPPFASRMLAQTERTILMHTPGSIRAMQSATSQQEHSGRGGGEGEGSSSGRGTEERERERKGAVKEQPSEVTACVICSIVEDAYLYITIDSVATAATEEGGEGETSTEVTDTLHAEALVHISSLFLSGEGGEARQAGRILFCCDVRICIHLKNHLLSIHC